MVRGSMAVVTRAALVAAVCALAGCPGSRPLALDAAPTDGLVFADQSNGFDWGPVLDGLLGDHSGAGDSAPTADGGSLADSGLPKDAGPPPPDIKVDAPCSGLPEQLDGKDNNCNGKVDEGYWAVTRQRTLGAMQAQHPACGAGNPFSDACTAAAHRGCMAEGYRAGFGPVEYDGTNWYVVCLADATLVQLTSFAALTAQHGGCGASNAWSMNCFAAIHRYCAANGHVSGVGPLEHSSSTVHLVCVKHAKVYAATWPQITAQHGGCTLGNAFSLDCRAATNRFCASKGHATGFGLVEVNTTQAVVTCLDRQ